MAAGRLDSARACASDAALVTSTFLFNPVYDGLNLISKKALSSTADGVIVLSEKRGRHEELNPHVLSINRRHHGDGEREHQAIVDDAEEKEGNESAREVSHERHRALITRQVQDIRPWATPGCRVVAHSCRRRVPSHEHPRPNWGRAPIPRDCGAKQSRCGKREDDQSREHQPIRRTR